MGIFDFFSIKLTQDKFAKLFEKSAREQGFLTPMAYQKEEFQMVIGNNSNHVFNLFNAYRDYGNAPKDQRDLILKRYTSSLELPKVPRDFQIAKSKLMPSVRSRSQGEYISFVGRLSGKENRYAEMSAPLGDDAVVMLSYDGEDSLSSVNKIQLEEWGVSFDAALEVAIENLRDRTVDKFVELGDGVILGDWNDAYDSSRILLPDLIFRASGGGDPVVMIPTRGRFFVASSRSPSAQLKMISLALQSFEQEGRQVSSAMYKISDGRLIQYFPPEIEVAALLAELKKMSSLEDYGSQKNMLEKLHTAEKKDLFVATFNLYKNPETGRVTSHATWSKDVSTLLPKTELITLFQVGATEEEHKTVLMRWEDMWEIAGHMLQEVEGYPLRYLTLDFPDDEVLASAPVAESMAPQ